MKDYIALFISFFKIGAFTFGGGYSMLPLMRKEIVVARKWTNEDEIIDIFALSQVTPGAIAVNAAVFVGSRLAGIRGAFCAAFGVALPSFLVISVIAAFLANFSDMPVVQHAFVGIRVAVAVLILDSLLRMLKGMSRKLVPVLICLVAFLASLFFDASPVLLVFAAGLCGFLLLGKKEAV